MAMNMEDLMRLMAKMQAGESPGRGIAPPPNENPLGGMTVEDIERGMMENVRGGADEERRSMPNPGSVSMGPIGMMPGMRQPQAPQGTDINAIMKIIQGIMRG